MSASSCFTRSGLASGLSILLMATIIGTRAARTWSMASLVCGMTPSSAATTMIAMSVTWAPRARMAVKASWPGVSRKTMRLPLCTTSLAPMCWVMPPRSPAATVVLRTASSRLVLPWSTWPMIVTIGARVTRSAASSSVKRTGLPAPSASSPGATISARAGGLGGRALGGAALDRLDAELACHQRGGVEVDRLVDGREDAVADQLLDDVGGADRQRIGQVLDRDRRGQLDRTGRTDRRRRRIGHGGGTAVAAAWRARASSWLISTGWHSVPRAGAFRAPPVRRARG